MNKNFREEYVTINGVQHYLLHFERNLAKPVVLFLHGGPGQSEAVFAPYIEDNQNSEYNIVYYDQRGAGKTYKKNPEAKANINNLKDDLFEIVKYICSYYKKKKIVILGHSWGTYLGSIFTLEHPEMVEAYIGTGQWIEFKKNEDIGYKKLLDIVNNDKDRKKIISLGEYPDLKSIDHLLYQMKYIRQYQGKYGLAMKIDAGMLKIAMKSPVFHLNDLKVMLSSFNHNKEVFQDFTESDLHKFSKDYKVPVHYILGENDSQAVTELAIEYFNEITAPKKSLQMIHHAGHMAYLDNKAEYVEKVNAVIENILPTVI